MMPEVKLKSHLQKLFDLLIENKLTIGAVESVSAGAFASKIVSIPGASAILKGSLVCYSNDCKYKFFKLLPSQIYTEETSQKLAKWASKHFDSKIGVSILGVAGPTVPNKNLKIGDLLVSIYYKETTKTYILNTASDKRDINSLVAVNLALQAIYVAIMGKRPQPTTIEEQLNLKKL